MKVATSFLSCKNIEKAIQKISATDADFIHVDFIDGKLYQGKKFPFRKLKKLFKYTRKRLDVHLMVKKPKKYIKKFASLNAANITFHIETGKNIEKNLELIQSFGIRAGLAISPNTEISRLIPYLEKIDLILIMSVMPGAGGQVFIEETIPRIKTVIGMTKKVNPNIKICVDGGINEEIAKKLKNVDMMIVGSYVTNQKNFQEAIDTIRNSVE